ncbi:heavy metal translocating P-type ATPase [Marinilactibacillus psychrotolerans]|uniref:Cd(2+)-exporting ATPase n=1 Tax=Marinilactibacillus psychrotolerans TaxID=191770 RepID=A0AAV3WSK9_9LACT|nr:cation-translocating P-type ATPase [Marinilactibacillus psychrotolerans]GEL67482.1 haloacid dehalogenase [Marinilactibacillus psychrotolerans]GEQ35643.1 cation-transporting ATPase [Marinilactibacillus psychrotolerans]SDC71817.1 Cd2+/Zn2+-exporting ATPase [Marinilactibacillus psychrotolerans]
MIGHINHHKNQITALAGLLIVIGFVLGTLGNENLQNIALIIATIISSVPIFIKAIQAIRMKAFSIDLLVSIAILGALYIGEYTESSVVTFLFLFGDYLEMRTLEKTRSSLRELVDMAPQEAVVLREGGNSEKVAIEKVEVGDRIIIRPGGKIPVDGSIISGKASINEATITGESIPASKTVDDKVFSGTILDTGYIEIVAERVGDDTTFAKVIELVEEAQESKSKAEKFLDKFAGIYTPAVVVLAIVVYLFTQDLHLAITFLVIACPGALVIGAPVSNVAGIGNGARNGVLIKGGEIMDKFSKVDTLVFDKTGTLTKGKPEVTDIHTFNRLDEEFLLGLVAKAEMISEHHLGQTIVKAAQNRGIDLASMEQSDGEVIKGNGIKAQVNGHSIIAGNRKLLQSEKISLVKAVEQYAVGREKQGNTAIFIVIDGKIAGMISIADQIREDAYKALAQMRENGIKKIVMLTGDNKHTAKAVATALELDEFHAELLPEQKVNYVKELKNSGHTVAMAGDGVNDAPAIATADIGLAMGEGGTDISMETADVVLMADKLMQFSHAYLLSKVTIRNMKQNIFIAVGVVAILLIGVLMGSVHLASGMFIHEASVLVVILNAMRLIRFNHKNMHSSKRLESVPAKA